MAKAKAGTPKSATIPLAPAAVVPFRADASLAYYNASLGATEVLTLRAQVAKELPSADLAQVESHADLALAVVFAAEAVDRDAPSSGTSRRLLAEAFPLRAALLINAEGLATMGLLPVREVARIRAGFGAIDHVNDLLALTALFQANFSEVKGKSPVTEEHLTKAADLGKRLLAVLKPAAAKDRTPASDAVKAAVDARDRLWTVLVQRHERLRRIACWLWGSEELDARVPSLQSRASAPRKKGTQGADAAPPAK